MRHPAKRGGRTRAVGVRLLDGAVIQAGWVRCARAPTAALRSSCARASDRPSTCAPWPSRSARSAWRRRQPRRPRRDRYRRRLSRAGSPRPDHPPDRHLHTTAASRDQAPDLMLWLSDPRGEPPVFEIDVVLLRLRSRGTVRLRSPDPTEPPSIELPNLRDPSDAERLAEGYRRGHEVASRPELRRLCDAPPSPEIRSADELPGLIRAEGYSFPHFRGPARWARCLTRRPSRFSGTRPRHRAAQRGRRVDRSQWTLGVHPHPDSHARRAARGTDRRLAMSGADTSIRAIADTSPALTRARLRAG